MPDRYYIHNLETDKLNIFTGGKADWMTIPEADRERIKSACLWSRSIEGWVSRAKGGKARFWSLEVLERNGFEDRGTEGERLTFREQLEVKQDRAEARADRMEGRQERAEDASNAAHKRSHDMLDAIPCGQPILVGHYSEGRDRRYRDRAWNLLGKAVKESEKAEHYAQRAAAARAAAARATAEGAEYSNPRYLGNRIGEVKKEIGILTRYLAGKRFGTLAAEQQDAEVCGEGTERTVTESDRERWERLLAEQEDKLEFFEHCLATCGRVIFDKASLAGKTAVKIRGRWEPIVKLNPKTVSVPNICFPLAEDQKRWALKYAYTEVQEAR